MTDTDKPDNVTPLPIKRKDDQKQDSHAATSNKLPLHIRVAEFYLDTRGQRGTDLRLVPDNDGQIHFWKYENGLWALLPDQKDVVKWLTAELQVVVSDDLNQKRKSCNKLFSEATQHIIRSAAVREPLEDFTDWDAHGKIPLKTDLIDPLTLAVAKTRKQDYCTWRLNIEYDADAKCPYWGQLLADAFSDRTEQDRATYISMLQEFLGTSMLSLRPKALSRELVLLGPTDCGKSVLLYVLSGLLSDNPISTSIKELGGTHGLQPFLRRGVPWVLHEAFDAGVWHQTSEMKSIVSGDPILINPKYGVPITIRPNNPAMHGTNHPPQWKDSSEAMVARTLIVPFTKKFDRESPVGVAVAASSKNPAWGPHDLILNTERAGLLNWALVGLKSALQRGYYVNTEAGKDALAEARLDSNVVAGFISECVDYDADVMISTVDFFGTLKKWFAERHGDKKDGGPSPDLVGRHLAALCDPRILQNKKKFNDRNGLRFYIGIKLNDGAGKAFFESCLTPDFDGKVRPDLTRMSTSYAATIRPVKTDWQKHPEVAALKVSTVKGVP